MLENIKWLEKLRNLKVLFYIYITITLIATIHQYLLPLNFLDGHFYARYNNYLIFKQTFIHLVNNQNLYSIITERYKHSDYWYWDYKYSPTFAVYMLPFAYLPVLAGLILWNILNSVVLFFSIKNIKSLNDKAKIAILWFAIIENITAIQSAQSNALIAGLTIFAFSFMEQRKFILATLLICISIFIKPFGILAFSFFLFYPEKIKFILFSLLWIIVLTALPLLFVSFSQLQYLYISWFNVLKFDNSNWVGLCVMGWLQSWFNLDIQKNIVPLVGGIVFCLPFLKFKYFKDFNFRVLYLASALIWMIIFNFRAESPTFIIAIAGVAIWFFSKKRKIEDLILVCLAFVFTSLSPTEIFPRYIKSHFLIPYVIKAVPCIFIWFKIIHEQLFYKSEIEKLN